MRTILFVIYLFLSLIFASAQEILVERIGQYVEIKQKFEEPEMGSPSGMVVNEIYENILIKNDIDRIEYMFFMYEPDELVIDKSKSKIIGPVYKFGDFEISSYNSWLKITQDGNVVLFKNDNTLIESGISFILKNADGYIAFFVNKQGVPGAADTTGNIYSPVEALTFLKIPIQIHMNKVCNERKT